MDPQAPIVRTIVAVDNPISGTGSSQPNPASNPDGPNRGVAQGQQFGGLEQRVRKGSAFHAVAAEQTFAGETGSFQRTARKKSTAATGAGKVSTYGGYAGQTRKGFGAKQVQKVLRLSPEQHAQLRDFQRPVKVTIFGFDEDDVDEVAELIKDAGKHQKLQLPPPVSPATTKILEQHLGQQAASALPGPAASTSAGPPPPPKPTLTASGGPEMRMMHRCSCSRRPQASAAQGLLQLLLGLVGYGGGFAEGMLGCWLASQLIGSGPTLSE